MVPSDAHTSQICPQICVKLIIGFRRAPGVPPHPCAGFGGVSAVSQVKNLIQWGRLRWYIIYIVDGTTGRGIIAVLPKAKRRGRGTDALLHD